MAFLRYLGGLLEYCIHLELQMYLFSLQKIWHYINIHCHVRERVHISAEPMHFT